MIAKADGIKVKSAELEEVGETLVLNADLEIGLSPALEEALNKGVPLNFVAEFELKKPRWYWLDESIAAAQRHYRLSYHALTRQYQLKLNDQYQNFSSLNEALHELGHLQEWPVGEKALVAEKPQAASKPLVVDKALVVGKPDGKTMLPDKSPLVKKRDVYLAGLRMRLDLAQLPKPLQVNALASTDWNLDSEWHRWNVTP
ncbi:MAG: DUF4390 domain-containing protein [Sulfuricella sp.]